MAETSAERRARVARELAELEHEGEQAEEPQPKRLSKPDAEKRQAALRGDLPLPGLERRPHLTGLERHMRQWPPSGSATVPHEPHSEVEDHERRRWPTSFKENS